MIIGRYILDLFSKLTICSRPLRDPDAPVEDRVIPSIRSMPATATRKHYPPLRYLRPAQHHPTSPLTAQLSHAGRRCWEVQHLGAAPGSTLGRRDTRQHSLYPCHRVFGAAADCPAPLPRDPKPGRIGLMGRKRTRLEISPAEHADLKRHLRSATDSRVRERLRMALDAASGRHTLEDLARRAGRARATIQLWLVKFARGGIEELLRRDTPPGSESPVGSSRIQVQLRAGLNSGRWRSAQEVASWLHQSHGIRRARKSIYYWLAKNGWPAPRTRGQQTPTEVRVIAHSRAETTRAS